jgi:hypothetical protein
MQTNAQIIESYLNERRIKATGYLAEAMVKGNWWQLQFVAFAIKQLPQLDNLAEKISELARIEKGNNEAWSRYYNLHFEFVSIWFVADGLGLTVVEVESHSHKIKSPNGKSGKHCDVLAKHGSNALYFEAKDFSAETLSLDPHPKLPNVFFFPPAHPHDVRKWIESQIRQCVKKGANFAICRVPSLGLPRTPMFGRRWVEEIFPMHKRIAKREYHIETSKSIPSFFRGVYLIGERRHLLLRFTST